MDSTKIYLSILVMGGVSYLIRVIPITLIKGKLNNRFLRSFLYYVPYVTLSVMTFPAITQATKSPVSGGLALAAGIITAWLKGSLFLVASVCCMTVLIVEMIL